MLEKRTRDNTSAIGPTIGEICIVHGRIGDTMMSIATRVGPKWSISVKVRRPSPRVLSLAAATAIVAAVVPVSAAAPPTSGLVPTAALGDVTAVGTTDGLPPVYVATTTGLYRAASPTYSLWSRQSPITDVFALSPNPRQPDDLLFGGPGGFGGATYRSLDGGQQASPFVPAPTRFSLAPRILPPRYTVAHTCISIVFRRITARTASACWTARWMMS